MKFILPILLISCGLGSATPHKFEDGFVERTLAIVVRDDQATAEYSLGLNQTTIQTLLKQWDSAPKTVSGETLDQRGHSAPHLKRTDASPQRRPPQPPEAQTTEGKSLSKLPAHPSLPFQIPSVTPETKKNLATPGIAPTGLSKTNIEEEDIISPEIFDKFKTAIATQITKNIQIKAGVKDLRINQVSVERAPRHPFNLLVKFQFKIPPAETTELRIIDETFNQQHGAVRYALKALGSTILLKSNVAPIVVRAKRVETKDLSPKELAEQTTILVRLSGLAPLESDAPSP